MRILPERNARVARLRGSQLYAVVEANNRSGSGSNSLLMWHDDEWRLHKIEAAKRKKIMQLGELESQPTRLN